MIKYIKPLSLKAWLAHSRDITNPSPRSLMRIFIFLQDSKDPFIERPECKEFNVKAEKFWLPISPTSRKFPSCAFPLTAQAALVALHLGCTSRRLVPVPCVQRSTARPASGPGSRPCRVQLGLQRAVLLVFWTLSFMVQY